MQKEIKSYRINQVLDDKTNDNIQIFFWFGVNEETEIVSNIILQRNFYKLEAI